MRLAVADLAALGRLLEGAEEINLRFEKEKLMPYVDGFVLPVAKRNLPAYFETAKKASKIWREHGALEYRECVGDDLKASVGLSFSRLAKLKAGETAVFSWIVYKSRSHRDRVNAKVMTDPRIKKMCNGKSMPFDLKRMAYGGFKIVVDAS